MSIKGVWLIIKAVYMNMFHGIDGYLLFVVNKTTKASAGRFGAREANRIIIKTME